MGAFDDADRRPFEDDDQWRASPAPPPKLPPLPEESEASGRARPIDSAPKGLNENRRLHQILAWWPKTKVWAPTWWTEGLPQGPHWHSPHVAYVKGLNYMRDEQPTHWMPEPEPLEL